MTKDSKQSQWREAIGEVENAAQAIVDLCTDVDDEIEVTQFKQPLEELRAAIAALSMLDDDDDDEGE